MVHLAEISTLTPFIFGECTQVPLALCYTRMYAKYVYIILCLGEIIFIRKAACLSPGPSNRPITSPHCTSHLAR